MIGLMRVLVILILFGLPAKFVQAETSSACTGEYLVQTGDTLAKIAKRCQTTVSEIVSNNPQLRNPNLIYSGTILQLPQASESGQPEVMSADEPEVQPAIESGEVYIVQLGDSLEKIARRHGRSVRDLILSNPKIKNPSVIYVGEQVIIPTQQQLDQALVQRQAEIVSQVSHNGERWIDVDLTTQTVSAYDGSELVRTFLASTGRANTPTVTGEYRIWIKFRYDDMRGPGYYLEDVPYVMYFYKGYGLHGTYWHSNFGTPMSHGCVNLATDDAAWLYEFADLGTLVHVH